MAGSTAGLALTYALGQAAPLAAMNGSGSRNGSCNDAQANGNGGGSNGGGSNGGNGSGSNGIGEELSLSPLAHGATASPSAAKTLHRTAVQSRDSVPEGLTGRFASRPYPV